MACVVIQVLATDVTDRTILNLKEEIGDIVSGQGLHRTFEEFTPESADLAELASTPSGDGRVRVYSV